MGEMGSFMEQMLREQYERKKQQQYLADRERERMQFQEQQDRARMLKEREHQALVEHDAQYKRGGTNAGGGGLGGLMGGGGGGGQSLMGGGGGVDPLESQVRHAALNDQMMGLEAKRSPQMKYQPGGAGYTGGWMMDDPAKLNAYQRELYLPKDSTVASSKLSSNQGSKEGGIGGGGIGSDEWADTEERNAMVSEYGMTPQEAAIAQAAQKRKSQGQQQGQQGQQQGQQGGK
jgi:hypothetical protein